MLAWRRLYAHDVLLLAQDQYQPRGRFQQTKVALCVHNIAFQVRPLAIMAHTVQLNQISPC